MKPQVSIIIVNYKVKEELINCINSINNSKPKVSYEIIVVDNDEEKTLKKELIKRFKNVRYVPNPVNSGYGAGNNLGAKQAIGKYLFFINPDTIVKKGVIESLIKALSGKNIGIVAPLLLNQKEEVYELQGTKILNPLRAIFSLTFINKWFPNNKFAKEYWMRNWNKKKDKEVDVVPGTAFVISKDLFETIGGFDEKFFLYFEEFDLCKRVRDMGLKIKIIANSKVIHFWESSTKKRNDINKIFSKSRFYYFKKNFGLANAFLVSFFTAINKNNLLLIVILIFGTFLRFYKLDQLMILIGDQGWFYLSARNLIVDHVVPLVGIPSSVVWLKQGAFGTYLIAFALWFGKLNPVSPAIFFSVLDIITICLVYYLGKKVINNTAGLFAAAFYATSPLILVMNRMPYHTSAIPFFAAVFFILLLKKKTNLNLLLLFLVLGLLIQLELSNAVLIAVLVVLFLIKRPILTRIKIIYSISGFLLGILPFIIYDLSNKFIQSIGLPLWIINRVRLFFGLASADKVTTHNFFEAIKTEWYQLSQIIYPFSLWILLLIILSTLFVLFLKRSLILKSNIITLLLWVFVPLFGFLIHAAPGAAYFPLIFPAVCLLIGFTFSFYSQINKIFIVVFVLIIFINAFSTVKANYFIWGDNEYRMPPNNSSFGPTYLYLDDIAEKIVVDAKTMPFSIKGIASLGKYESGVDHFKYLIHIKGGKIIGSSELTYFLYTTEDLKDKKMINKKLVYKNKYFYLFKNGM